LTAHIRGPFNLLKFGVYTIGGKASKREEEPHSHFHAKRHGHQHLHRRAAEKAAEEKKREEGDVWVTAVIDGKTVSWINTYHGPTAAPEPPAAAGVPDAGPAAPAPAAAASSDELKRVAGDAKFIKSSKAPQAVKGDYSRVAYYDADAQTAEGLVFLGHYGARAGSGTFDT